MRECRFNEIVGDGDSDDYDLGEGPLDNLGMPPPTSRGGGVVLVPVVPDSAPNSHMSASNHSLGAAHRNRDGRATCFDIPSVSRTDASLRALDACVGTEEGGSIKAGSALDDEDDATAIQGLLRKARSPCNADFLPSSDVRSLFSPRVNPGEDVDRNKFTSSEDALLLLGVLKHGERRWDRIHDEFLPTRKMPNLSVRYCKIFSMMSTERWKRGGAVTRRGKSARPRGATVDGSGVENDEFWR